MFLKYTFLCLVSTALVSCGGSSNSNQSNPSISSNHDNNNSENDNTVVPEVSIQHALKLGSTNHFLTSEYTGIPISSQYEGSYWMIVRAEYTVDSSYFELITSVKDVARSIVHIIKDDNEDYWMVQPWYDDVGTIYPLFIDDTANGEELTTFLNVYGGEVLLRTYSIESDSMKAKIETYPYSSNQYEISTSQIDFIKISDSPRLSGVWKDNQEDTGMASWYQSDYAAEDQYAFNPIPLHLFIHGYQEAISNNYAGELESSIAVEYVQVGSIIENLQSRIDDPDYRYTDGVGYTTSVSLTDNNSEKLLNRIYTEGGTINEFYSNQVYTIDLGQKTLSFVNEFTNVAINAADPDRTGDKTVRVDIEFDADY